MPTGLAAGDNEIKQRRDLSESIFREWLPADAVRDGAIHDWAMTKTQRGEAYPSVCYPVRGTTGVENLIYFRWQKCNAVLGAALSSDTGKHCMDIIPEGEVPQTKLFCMRR